MATRMFYAIVYAYGRTVVNQGNRADYVHRFPTIAERQAFIAQHEDAAPASARDALVRKAVRYAAVIGDNWPIAV